MLFKREKYLKKIRPFYDDDDIIKVITGVRRCGKSSLMQTVAQEIEESGVKKENIHYFDLDKLAYRKIRQADELETLIVPRLIEGEKNYLFLDEVQNVDGFEEVLNGLRTDGNCSIFITGSHSYLLSGELVTKLTGRYLEFEMFTLSFDEYIQMKRFYGKQVNANLQIELVNYINEGGFPRTIQMEDENAKRTYVSGVIREIFEKDIRCRVKIKDVATFETVRQYLINNFGATTSVKALTEALNKNGIAVSRATVAKYIEILVNAKIVYECSRFDMKSKRSLSGEKKYYPADLSFYYSQNTDNCINYGPVLESIVYFYAKGHDYRVSVGRIGRLECDFILRRSSNHYSYVQVSYTIMQSRETEDREYRPLEQIRDNYDKYVMTTDYALQHRNGIHHVNLMEFMAAGELF